MIKLKEYMNNSLEDRRSHLDLSLDCQEIGGNSSTFRGILSITLKTTMDYSLAYCCHACNNDKCSNPKHLYWGTPKENVLDCKEIGRFKNFYQSCVDKFGEKEYKNLLKRYGSLGGKKSKKITLSEEVIKIRLNDYNSDLKEYGRITRLSKKWNISHTQVRNFLNKYASLV